jgi:aryl-alcohol dehydrogenase-like predicted oxidoreductase
LWTRDPEPRVLPACKELGVGFVPFSPIGRAALTGTIDPNTKFEPGSDMRSTMPRFSAENLDRNLALVEDLKAEANAIGATPAQLALAWLLSQGDRIVPIPGTKRRRYLEENAAAASLALDQAVIDRLTAAFAPDRVAGERYGHSWMKSSDSED